jgi:hypothetical protein
LKVLAFSTTSLHLPRSWTQTVQFLIFILQMYCLTLLSHLLLDLPCNLVVIGFHLYIFLTILLSDILCTCPNQLSHWALIWLNYKPLRCNKVNTELWYDSKDEIPVHGMVTVTHV